MEFSEYFNVKQKVILDSLLEALFLLIWEDKYAEKNCHHSWMIKEWCFRVFRVRVLNFLTITFRDTHDYLLSGRREEWAAWKLK